MSQKFAGEGQKPKINILASSDPTTLTNLTQVHQTKRRWTKKTDIFSYSLILVPVFLRIHWCLASIDMEKKTITYHDSMGGNNMGCLQTLAEYLKEEHLTRKGVSVFIKEYVLFL